jgi:methionyl-tRNA formyltransferase
VFRLVPELDAGDVFAMRARPAGDDTAGELLEALAHQGADLLAEVVDGIADGSASATPQAGEPTFAPKLGIDDARLDWTAPADTVRSRFRGVTPEPGAWTTVDDQRVKVLDLGAATSATATDAAALVPGALELVGRQLLIGTGTSPLELRRVQPAGRTAMSAADWWRGSGRDGAVAR